MKIEKIASIVPKDIVITMSEKEARELYSRLEEPDMKENMGSHAWSVLGDLKCKIRKTIES